MGDHQEHARLTTLPDLGRRAARGELLDWIEDTGHCEAWVADFDPAPPTDPYNAAAQMSSTWQSISSGHMLVYLVDSPSNIDARKALDWVPATMHVHIWRFKRCNISDDPMPGKLDSSSFSTIGSGHTLLHLDRDHVLDWRSGTGRTRVWHCSRARTKRRAGAQRCVLAPGNLRRHG